MLKRPIFSQKIDIDLYYTDAAAFCDRALLRRLRSGPLLRPRLSFCCRAGANIISRPPISAASHAPPPIIFRHY